MKTIQTRKNTPSFFRGRFFLVLLIAIFLLSLNAVITLFQKGKAAAEEKQLYEEQYLELEHKRKELQQRIDYLSTEQGMEAELRKNHNAVKPNEKVIKIVE